ncbi:MAG: 30S ribosomal protein S15 [Candidatus Nanohaloarchaeota archaeon QJJ-9]|nr:30S ribosomal protein S15 [Candidatus Nanohaloarchaeota archaeon QJJ-9]
MSRMHSDGRGSSGSTKPRNPSTNWVVYEEDEIVQLVEKLAKKDKKPSEIGGTLRDRYGVPDVQAITGKSITDILEEKGLSSELPEDLYSLLEKAVRMKEHFDKNPKDKEARRRLELTEAKIRRIAEYHRGERIPEDWSYNREKAELLIK